VTVEINGIPLDEPCIVTIDGRKRCTTLREVGLEIREQCSGPSGEFCALNACDQHLYDLAARMYFANVVATAIVAVPA
jgi:hypothetical protein